MCCVPSNLQNSTKHANAIELEKKFELMSLVPIYIFNSYVNQWNRPVSSKNPLKTKSSTK